MGGATSDLICLPERGGADHWQLGRDDDEESNGRLSGEGKDANRSDPVHAVVPNEAAPGLGRPLLADGTRKLRRLGDCDAKWSV